MVCHCTLIGVQGNFSVPSSIVYSKVDTSGLSFTYIQWVSDLS
jgi:hypothetical protein